MLLLKKLIQQFEEELHRVNDVGHFFEDVLKKEDAQLQLLANYRRIDELLHEFVAAVHDQTIKVFPEDLPKKLSELRFDVRKLATYKELNAAKEAMLLKVLQKREDEVEKLDEAIKKDLEVESRKCYRYCLHNPAKSKGISRSSRPTSWSATTAECSSARSP